MTFLGSLREEFSFIKGNYAVLVTSWILIDFAMELPATYYGLYVLELGATATILGVIGLSQFLALASMQFPGGYLADKYGRKWLISTMTFGVAVSFILYAIAPSWHFILIGAVLMSIFNSTYQPALSAMVSDSLPAERRGMGFSIVMLIASASTTPSPAVAGVLRANFGLVDGMRIAYGMVVTLFLIAAFFRFLFLKETVVTASKPRFNEILQSYPTALKESFSVWKKVPRPMLYLFLSFSVAIFGFSATNVFTVVYATKVLLIDEVMWAFITALVPITTIISAIPVGKLVDKLRRKTPLLASILVFGLAMWVFVNGDLAKVALSLILFGAGNVMLNASFGALQTDLTPKELRGKVNGFINFANYIIMAVGSLLGGYLYQYMSPQAPFILAIAMVIPSFLLTLALVKEPEKREE
ncbi:MAG: MFS transporter [Candidatus Bathyarchaeota archaeon]|nr:MAG: MFS transporter [Candidatus Bathyarchaeota archaeon]